MQQFIEAACLAAGCNFRCPQCYNWSFTYQGVGDPLTPHQAAERLTGERHKHKVNRMLVSGGECTLNRPWLVQFITEMKRLNPDSGARFHVQTNGSLLDSDYIDELIGAGIPFNTELISVDEVIRIGKKVREISPSIQVGVLRYRADYRSHISPPDDAEIEQVRDILNHDVGLETALAWTEDGEIGP